jgi:hypothetical protein
LHGAFLSFNCEFDFPGERRIAIKEAIPQFDVDGPPALG